MTELPPPVCWWGHSLGEARVHLELARLLPSATWRGEDVPHGAGPTTPSAARRGSHLGLGVNVEVNRHLAEVLLRR